MVHLINPRANHQAHSTHSFKGLAVDTALWFTWEDSQHMCLQEQAVGTWSRAAAEMGLLGAAQLCQPHPKHHTRCPTHSEWKCAFSLGTVCFVSGKAPWRPIKSPWGTTCRWGRIQVPPAQGQERGLLPSILMAPWGLLCSYCLGCDEQAAATRASWQATSVASLARSVPTAPLAMGWAACQRCHECSREPEPSKLWRARLLQQEHNSESLALTGIQQKVITSCKLWHWWPREQQGESTPPATLLPASTQHDLAGQSRSLHSVNYQSVAASVLCFLFHLLHSFYLTSLWFSQVCTPTQFN